MNTQPPIEIKNLWAKYPSPKRGVPPKTAVAELDLEIRSTVLGLPGPNGAGKTTTMNVLLGFRERHFRRITRKSSVSRHANRRRGSGSVICPNSPITTNF